jgi:hypothetical protein
MAPHRYDMSPRVSSFADVDWGNIPDHLRYSIRAYVERGRVPGAFLVACLANDGYEMVMRVPTPELGTLIAIVQFCHRYLPPECFGSPEKVADWEELGGLTGIAMTAQTGTLGWRS